MLGGLQRVVRPRGHEVGQNNSNLGCPTLPDTPIETKEKKEALPNQVLEGNTATKNAVSVEAEHGVKSDKKAVNFREETYHSSGNPVKDLCHAIEACPPDVASQIMAAALEELSQGGPVPTFLRADDDAAFWASIAAPQDLIAYCAATVRAVGKRAWAIAARKRLFVLLWDGFSPDDKVKFLAKADPRGRFQGRAL